jgi:hypothetical protein
VISTVVLYKSIRQTDTLERKIDGIDQRTVLISGQLDHVEKQIARVETQAKQAQDNTSGTTTGELGLDVHRLDTKLDQLAKDIAALKGRTTP